MTDAFNSAIDLIGSKTRLFERAVVGESAPPGKRDGKWRAGTPLDPRNVLRALGLVLKAADLPLVRFHDLRHSAASLLIAEGLELVAVSMLLGHSGLRVTADPYTHTVKQTASKAATHMDAPLSRKR